MRSMRRALGPVLGTYVPLVPYIVFALFPLYFMLITSFKTDSELYEMSAPPFLVREGTTLDHYRLLLQDTAFLTWLGNTLFVSVLATLVSVVIGTFAAYALARLSFRGAAGFGVAIFITYLVPPSLLFLPLTRVVSAFGLSDSLWSLVVTYPTFLVPFTTWLLMGYFRTIPKEIEDCALVDGCDRLQALLRVVLPLAVPGIVCAILFAFTISWNEFLYSLVFVSPTVSKTVTVGVVSELVRGDIFYWGALMAGGLVGALPIVLAYVFFLDYYVTGLTAGAVKG
jgi:multiple sugar transport system permease protein